jgi:hypothetical protein
VVALMMTAFGNPKHHTPILFSGVDADDLPDLLKGFAMQCPASADTTQAL